MTIKEKREKNRLKNIAWRKNNREKCCQATADWRTRNPYYERNRKWKKRYGITPERYDEMVKIQNNRCLICGNEEIAKHNYTKKVQKLAVDHDHITGKVRGLLCQDCNQGLGKFYDDILRLEKAIQYLKK